MIEQLTKADLARTIWMNKLLYALDAKETPITIPELTETLLRETIFVANEGDNFVGMGLISFQGLFSKHKTARIHGVVALETDHQEIVTDLIGTMVLFIEKRYPKYTIRIDVPDNEAGLETQKFLAGLGFKEAKRSLSEEYLGNLSLLQPDPHHKKCGFLISKFFKDFL